MNAHFNFLMAFYFLIDLVQKLNISFLIGGQEEGVTKWPAFVTE